MPLAEIGTGPLLAHTVVFLAALGAGFLLPVTLAQVFRLSPVTIAAVMTFFLSCAANHLSFALDDPYSWWAQVAAYTQAVAGLAIVICIVYDLGRATDRLARAFIAFELRFGKEEAGHIERTIEKALNGRDDDGDRYAPSPPSAS